MIAVAGVNDQELAVAAEFSGVDDPAIARRHDLGAGRVSMTMPFDWLPNWVRRRTSERGVPAPADGSLPRASENGNGRLDSAGTAGNERCSARRQFDHRHFRAAPPAAARRRRRNVGFRRRTFVSPPTVCLRLERLRRFDGLIGSGWLARVRRPPASRYRFLLGGAA